ncbi:hypothetical protein A1A1_01618 [Planococcus antarcticus DSM 14505]|uniref:Uncharacterized protein n=1 Tax=Planococcus antarcticus DSM 14505 TaxID=1185653 RepID=A0A1C7DJ96_9BACL|nr:hypothetical protein BBH88_15945 [Planococcus antarcticus DSM 14505]EIM08281.1 hypothetical protein A1A1_01618 [Planococcus antarcticus DSM 14505]
MEEAYRQRYTEGDTIDWNCVFKNKIAIMPHLFLQVKLTINDIEVPVKKNFRIIEKGSTSACFKEMIALTLSDYYEYLY